VTPSYNFRKDWLGLLRKGAVMIILMSAIIPSQAGGKAGKSIILENDVVKAAFDQKSGALLHLENKASHWTIMDRGELAQSFELLLPLDGAEMTDEDIRYNVIKGTEQSSPEISSTSSSITFKWTGLKSNNMKEPADITFIGKVELTGNGLVFSGSVTNNSSYQVEYVSWPCIGEISIPDAQKPLFHSTKSDQRELYPHMFNQHGYWGVEWPTSTYVLPEKSYVQVYDDEGGFMVYNRAFPQNVTIVSFELIPGFAIRSTNPKTDEMDGEEVRIQFKANNCTYAMPGSSAELDPVCLKMYSGGWENGVRLYAKERIPLEAGNRADADWMDGPMLWRKAGGDLSSCIEESVASGVDVLLAENAFSNATGQINESQWLEDAIEKCHEVGLKVILGTAWTKVSRRAPNYSRDFRNEVMSDQFINLPYNYEWLCPSSENVREYVGKDWKPQEAFRTADGYINQDHGNTNHSLMCFDMDHGHRFGQPTIAGSVQMDKEMADAIAADKAAIGFGFSDFQNDYYDALMLNVPENFISRQRVAFPNTRMLISVDVRNARRLLNKALLYRLIPVYDPNFFDDRLEDYPHIVEYGKEVKSFQKKYADRIWNADFIYHDGASVTGSNLEWTVFRSNDGLKAIVITNNGTEHASTAKVDVEGGRSLGIASPSDDEIRPFQGSISIDPQSTIVVLEK
jgi:hypothetical protein